MDACHASLSRLRPVRAGAFGLITALAVLTVPLIGQTTFVYDSFTGTAGAVLSSHNPDIPNTASWQQLTHTSSTSTTPDTLQLTGTSGRLKNTHTNTNPGVYSNTKQSNPVSSTYVVLVTGLLERRLMHDQHRRGRGDGAGRSEFDKHRPGSLHGEC